MASIAFESGLNSPLAVAVEGSSTNDFATVVNLALTVPFAVLFGLVGVVAATVVGLLASSLYFVVLCRRIAGLRDRRLTLRWAGATALGAIATVLGELLVLRLEWHGLVPLLLAGLPVLAGLLVAVAVAARDAPVNPLRGSTARSRAG